MADEGLRERQRRRRNVAIGLTLGAFILLIYVVSFIRMGG